MCYTFIMKTCWLDNKTFIITGASSGIGRGITEKLILNHNCTIIGIGRSKEKLAAISTALGDKQNLFIPYPLDVTDKEAWRVFKEGLTLTPDGIINCAGVLPPFKRAEKASDEDVEKILSTNFLSVVYSFNALKDALSPHPAIINVASSAALCTIVGTSAYSASKSALKSYTEAMIYEMKGKAYVALVMPGFARTDIFRAQNSAITDSKLFMMMSMPADKMINKIYRGIKRKKTRMVYGKDAHAMSVFYRLMPKTSMLVISKILKKANVKLFDEVFK